MMVPAVMLWIALVSLVLPYRSFAEESAPPQSNIEQIRQNLELSYVCASLGNAGVGNLEKLVFEANFAPVFFTPEFKLGGRFLVSFTPKILLRMFWENSTPVRTPSYMPQFTLFAWLQKEVTERKALQYATMTIGHHSNGQQEHFYDLNTLYTNRREGGFSTNWVSLEYHITLPDNRILAVSSAFAGIEQHVSTGRSDALDGHYGYTRLNLGACARWQFAEDWELKSRLRLTLLLGPFSPLKKRREGEHFPSRLVSSLETSVRHKSMGQFGLFAKVHFGQDYYNIYMDRELFSVLVGFSADMGTWSWGQR